MKIDASMIKASYRTDLKDGLYAEFDSDGQLLHLANYVEGQPQGWALTLEPNRQQGRVERNEIHQYESDSAALEALDTADTTETEGYCDWVSGWIEQITGASDWVLRCSFCEKTQTEVKKLIAGPSVYICDECVALCQEILHQPSTAQSDAPAL